MLLIVASLGLIGLTTASASAADKLPLLFEDDFENGADRWQPTDAKAWKILEVDGRKVYNQFQKSNYNPPHRSPLNISLVKDVVVGDFDLTVKVQSTARDYGHRDVCLFLGYQDAKHFYYIHLAKQADPHANQIFIVNDAPRTMITEKKSEGTAWDDAWHSIKVVRRVADGTIEVYFDDMTTPHMAAKDKTFVWGQVGLGSFDDTANWDDFKLFGTKVEKK
jgi:hypothetical protein